MLAELHVLKFPAGIVGSPPADGRRARRPAKPANYIVVMVRCASSGVVPRIVLSARRLGRADSVNQIGRLLRGQSPRRAHRLLRSRRVLSANRVGVRVCPRGHNFLHDTRMAQHNWLTVTRLRVRRGGLRRQFPRDEYRRYQSSRAQPREPCLGEGQNPWLHGVAMGAQREATAGYLRPRLVTAAAKAQVDPSLNMRYC